MGIKLGHDKGYHSEHAVEKMKIEIRWVDGWRIKGNM